MSKAYKKLKCAKLFGGDCKFVHESKTLEETMHVFWGHLSDQHAEIMKSKSKEDVKATIEKNLE